MSVEDWARREAERYASGDVYGEIEPAFRNGAMTFANALLSDEAVKAARKVYMQTPKIRSWEVPWRAAIQAAIDAVTKEARND